MVTMVSSRAMAAPRASNSWPNEVNEPSPANASGYPLQLKSVPIGVRIARTPGLRRLAEKLLPRSVIEDGVRNVYVDQSKVTPEVVDRYFELTLVKAIDQLKSLQVPTLILWGAKDRLIQRFDAGVPNSALVVFPNVGHLPQEEAPEFSVAAVEKWLAALP